MTDDGVHPAAIIVPVIVGILLLCEFTCVKLLLNIAVIVSCIGLCRETGYLPLSVKKMPLFSCCHYTADTLLLLTPLCSC